MSSNKLFSILFLKSVNYFDPNDYMLGGWSIDNYYLVRQMPLAEMMSDTVVALAEETMDLSNSAEWHELRRRPVSAGDIIAIGDELYLFMPSKYITNKIENAIDMPSRPSYKLVRLEAEGVERWLNNAHQISTT